MPPRSQTHQGAGPVRLPLMFVPLLLCLASAALADAVDDYARAVIAREGIPGISVLIVRGGAVQKAQGYGLANVELNVPASAATIYQSGSMGKQFTAAGILKLVEAGRLTLDDRLSTFFSDGPPAWRHITIRQLLTHTSGIHDYEGSPAIDLRKDYDEAALLEVMKGLPQDFEPGSQWSYSNSGYLILGILTSKLAGMHWSEFQAQRLFAPLGMKTTRVISESAIIPNRAAGYEREANGALKNQDWVAPSLNRLADGSLYFSIQDLAAWDAALRTGTFLSAASKTEWWKPVQLTDGSTYQYGFGWDIDEQRGHRLIEHGGSWQGFRTAIARYVDDDLTVAVLANVATADPTTIAHDIGGLVEAAVKLPDAGATPRDPDAALSKRLQQVLRAWAEHRVDPAMARGLAHTNTHAAREAGSRREVGKALASLKTWRYIGEDVLRQPLNWRDEPVTRIAHYVLESGGPRQFYRFYLTSAKQVADFRMSER